VDEGAWPPHLAPQGQAELQASWAGGWGLAQRWWQAASQAGGPDWPRLAALPPAPLDLQWQVPRLALAAGADASRAEAWQGRLLPQAQGWSLVQQGRFLHQGHQVQLDSELLARLEAGGLQLSTPRLDLQAQLAHMPARYARWTLRPAAPLSLRLADGEALLGAGELALGVPGLGTQALALRWSDSQWRRGSGLLSQGELRGLPLSWIDSLSRSERQPDGAMAEAGLLGDLLFDAQWKLALPPSGTAQAKARLSIERRSGDLALRAGTVAGQSGALQAGIRAAAVTLDVDGDALSAQLRWDSELAGQIDARLDSRWQGGLDEPQWPADAPLQGHLKAQLPQVGLWSALAPPGWRMSGAAQANATISGTRAAPQWDGELRGEKLALRSLVDGIEFVQGELQAVLRGERLVIERLRIEGPGGAASGGSLVASGEASWQRGEGGKMVADMALKAQADKLRVSVRADRRLTVSGDVDGRLQGERLVLRGQLRADQASFILPDESTPSLGSDVVVRRPGQAGRAGGDGASRVATDLHLTLDLGRQFEVRGHGLEARLEGQLELISTPAQPAPRVLGEVRTARGTYRAYGQRLDIEQGVLRFAGPYDNPALDVLAIRPYTSQRVGVQIRGTAQAPQVRLYSDPELPDSEKLAWLVLGRSASGGGAEAAVLQQAAMALLSGSSGGNPLGQLFGLDEVSVRGASSSTSSGGETVSGATLTLGKRLSNRLYVAYERSLAGTLGTFSIFYDVSRRLTLRARTGEDQAIDLIFTLPYD
jgi:translocation and assembly module TamB